MNPASRRRLACATAGLFALAAVLAAQAPAAPAAPKNVDRFARTKAHIDALLKLRLKPEPLPAVLPNPFLLTGPAPAAPGPGGADAAPLPGDRSAPAAAPLESAPLTDDAEILARHIGNLKLGGIVELNGRVQLMVNQSPRKEGDIIVIHDKDEVAYLQIVRLTPRELTLRYKDTQQVVRLKSG